MFYHAIQHFLSICSQFTLYYNVRHNFIKVYNIIFPNWHLFWGLKYKTSVFATFIILTSFTAFNVTHSAVGFLTKYHSLDNLVPLY